MKWQFHRCHLTDEELLMTPVFISVQYDPHQRTLHNQSPDPFTTAEGLSDPLIRTSPLHHVERAHSIAHLQIWQLRRSSRQDTFVAA